VRLIELIVNWFVNSSGKINAVLSWAMLNLDSFLLQVSVQKLLYSRRRITVELFRE